MLIVPRYHQLLGELGPIPRAGKIPRPDPHTTPTSIDHHHPLAAVGGRPGLSFVCDLGRMHAAIFEECGGLLPSRFDSILFRLNEGRGR